ncbi:phage holin [Enterobacter sp. Bisph1]|uniref:phage holin n=1 Tax=Enterobacter sp. Bisph1 TaxID=1274399 RepID=UPI000691B837|nr:phage holin [Enterobacter sp. Bisph1]
MYRMDKLTTGVSYGFAGANGGYWVLQLLDKVSPLQWAAIGVLASIRQHVEGKHYYFWVKQERGRRVPVYLSPLNHLIGR